MSQHSADPPQLQEKFATCQEYCNSQGTQGVSGLGVRGGKAVVTGGLQCKSAAFGDIGSCDVCLRPVCKGATVTVRCEHEMLCQEAIGFLRHRVPGNKQAPLKFGLIHGHLRGVWARNLRVRAADQPVQGCDLDAVLTRSLFMLSATRTPTRRLLKHLLCQRRFGHFSVVGNQAATHTLPTLHTWSD